MLGFLKKKLKAKKSDGPGRAPPATAGAPAAPPGPGQSNAGRVIAFVSTKGGAGKSILAANLVAALSVVGDPPNVIAVDTDIVNRTLSYRLLAPNDLLGYLNEKKVPTFLDYIRGLSEDYRTVSVTDEKSRFRVCQYTGCHQVAEGGRVFLLPASRMDVGRAVLESLMGRSDSDLQAASRRLVTAFKTIARRNGLQVVVDLPVLSTAGMAGMATTMGRVNRGILAILEVVDEVVLVSSDNPAEVQGLVTILDTDAFSFIRTKVAGIVFNRASQDDAASREKWGRIARYVWRKLGRIPIVIIPTDPAWERAVAGMVPPILYPNPVDRGANRAFLLGMTLMGRLAPFYPYRALVEYLAFPPELEPQRPAQQGGRAAEAV